MNKQNKIIVGVIALVLALTVGYALFNSSLTINGTAKASGEFNIKFKEVGEIKEVGSKNTTASITGANSDTLTVNVPNLEYPTSYVEIPVTVVNDGTIDGKLTGIVVENLETDDIKVTYSGISEGEVFRQKEEKPMLIKIMWKDNSTVEASNLTFQIGLKYQQITVADIGSTTSSDSSSFPILTGSLGNNVTYTYNNGNILIEGSGNMSMDELAENDECYLYANEMDKEYCTLLNELTISAKKTLSINRDNIYINMLIGSFLTGNSYEDLGDDMTKENIKRYLMSNDGGSLSKNEVNDLFDILDRIPKLKSIEISNGITSIRPYLFFAFNAPDITITFPNTISEKSKNVFDVAKIGTITFEKNTKIIYEGLAYSSDTEIYTEIYNVIIPDGVETIQSNSIELRNFSSSTSTTITIPQSVINIEQNSIYCNDLTTIINKTGKAFDWNGILGGTSSNSFETGTVEVNGRTITITK